DLPVPVREQRLPVPYPCLGRGVPGGTRRGESRLVDRRPVRRVPAQLQVRDERLDQLRHLAVPARLGGQRDGSGPVRPFLVAPAQRVLHISQSNVDGRRVLRNRGGSAAVRVDQPAGPFGAGQIAVQQPIQGLATLHCGQFGLRPAGRVQGEQIVQLVTAR